MDEHRMNHLSASNGYRRIFVVSQVYFRIFILPYLLFSPRIYNKLNNFVSEKLHFFLFLFLLARSVENLIKVAI